MLCCGFSVSVESFFCFNHSLCTCMHIYYSYIYHYNIMMHADMYHFICMHVYTQKNTEWLKPKTRFNTSTETTTYNITFETSSAVSLYNVPQMARHVYLCTCRYALT